MPVNRIDLEDLALRTDWPFEQGRRTDIKRDLEAGQARVAACYRIEPQDVFLIASHSGMNAALAEVALHAKEHRRLGE